MLREFGRRCSRGRHLYDLSYAAWQPSFVSSQRVPSGYYFLVADILVTPYGGSTGNATVGFYLFNAYATSGRAETNFFRSVDGQTFGEHFVSPMFVLLPDHRLEVVGFNSNQQTFDIRVTGLLVNNVTYLPVLRNVN